MFINEEATSFINGDAISVINEAAIGAIIAPTNPASCFFLFPVSVASSINIPDFSCDSIQF